MNIHWNEKSIKEVILFFDLGKALNVDEELKFDCLRVGFCDGIWIIAEIFLC